MELQDGTVLAAARSKAVQHAFEKQLEAVGAGDPFSAVPGESAEAEISNLLRFAVFRVSRSS